MGGGIVNLFSVLRFWIVCRLGGIFPVYNRAYRLVRFAYFCKTFNGGGNEGFRFVYFHVEFKGMWSMLYFILFQTWF
jgi:hypothetical protein